MCIFALTEKCWRSHDSVLDISHVIFHTFHFSNWTFYVIIIFYEIIILLYIYILFIFPCVRFSPHMINFSHDLLHNLFFFHDIFSHDLYMINLFSCVILKKILTLTWLICNITPPPRTCDFYMIYFHMICIHF